MGLEARSPVCVLQIVIGNITRVQSLEPCRWIRSLRKSTYREDRACGYKLVRLGCT